jgi:hypothetical protein
LELTAHCSLARAYATHSNAHDLDAIGELLATDARYESVYAGVLAGRVVILEMMRGYFEKFPDVTWIANDYEEVSPGQVAFDFHMRATDGDGVTIERDGREVITFTRRGRIASIRVGGREAAPRG